MTSIIATYPEFVNQYIQDMLVGSIEYHKNKFEVVLRQLMSKLEKKSRLIVKAEEFQAFLESFPKNELISVYWKYSLDTYDTSCISAVFHLTWNTIQIYGPSIIVIYETRCGNTPIWDIEMPHYQTMTYDQQRALYDLYDVNEECDQMLSDGSEGRMMTNDGIRAIIYAESARHQMLF